MELLIDSHAHLTDKAFDEDREEVLQGAAHNGIDRVVCVAESLGDAQRVAGLAEQYDLLAPTAGVHPHKAVEWNAGSAHVLATLADDAGICALGEIGLDYHYDFSPREKQREVFREQLNLAKELRRPVIVHCREAEPELMAILTDAAPASAGGVVHCFNGDEAMARRVVDLGLHIGIGGMATFKKMKALREIVRKAIPLERLLVETDAPYLAPEPKRGRRNEPALVRHVAECLAGVYDVEPAELAAQTRRNAMGLFGLGPEIPADSIAYRLGRSLYLNLTNRCTNECEFCGRMDECSLAGYDLRLEREPTAGEVIAAAGDSPGDFDEVVFCGYGEPTFRLRTILWVGRWLKANGARRIRLNTNGQGNEIHGRSISGDLAEVVDVVSVSLNAATEEDYRRICRPIKDRYRLENVIRFLEAAKQEIGEVRASAVDVAEVDMEAVRELAESRLGVPFFRRG